MNDNITTEELRQQVCRRLAQVESPLVLGHIINFLNLMGVEDSYNTETDEAAVAWVERFGAKYLSNKLNDVDFFIKKIQQMHDDFNAERSKAQERQTANGKKSRWIAPALRRLFFGKGCKYGLYFKNPRELSLEAVSELLQTDEITAQMLSKAKKTRALRKLVRKL